MSNAASPDDHTGGPKSPGDTNETGSEKQYGPKRPATEELASSMLEDQPTAQSSKHNQRAKRPRHQPPLQGVSLPDVPTETDLVRRDGDDPQAWSAAAQLGGTRMNVVALFSGTEDALVSLTNTNEALCHAADVLRDQGYSDDMTTSAPSIDGAQQMNAVASSPGTEDALVSLTNNEAASMLQGQGNSDPSIDMPNQMNVVAQFPGTEDALVSLTNNNEALCHAVSMLRGKGKREATQAVGSKEPTEEPREAPVDSDLDDIADAPRTNRN